jgi:hypothetical protein
MVGLGIATILGTSTAECPGRFKSIKYRGAVPKIPADRPSNRFGDEVSNLSVLCVFNESAGKNAAN